MSDDDDTWREIVENYGETPQFPEGQFSEGQFSEGQLPDAAAEPDTAPQPGPDEPVGGWFRGDAAGEEERYVPPPPPPIPRPEPIRLAAWCGVLLSPLVLTVAVIIGWHLPTLVSVVLVGSFVGGFGLLVWQLPKGPSDPWDDGARV